MTAPDSRDSVEKIVAEMRNPPGRALTHLEYMAWILTWADRLQALARGPQQAGGEYKHEPALTLDENIILKQQDTIATLQAEVARLKASYVELETMYQQQGLNAFALLKRAETAEAALQDAGRDAERYRWLRRDVELVRYASGMDHPPLNRPVIVVAEDQNGRIREFALSDDDADTAIDAALNGGQDDA